MIIGTGVIELHLPGNGSLKGKRSILKNLKARLHKEFNVSCAEIDLHDVWQSAALGIAVVSTSPAHAERVIESVVAWVEQNRPDIDVVGYTIEIIS
jgi:uncharacterized protein YlxP (DUF503 family)